MSELERAFAVGRQRIICVSLSLTVKSINSNKNTPKLLPINAEKLLEHLSTHSFDNVGCRLLQKNTWHKLVSYIVLANAFSWHKMFKIHILVTP